MAFSLLIFVMIPLIFVMILLIFSMLAPISFMFALISPSPLLSPSILIYSFPQSISLTFYTFPQLA